MSDRPIDVAASIAVAHLDDVRFLALPVDGPEDVTAAIATTLTAHLGRPVLPRPDGVFCLLIPGGAVELRAHRSLPLVVLRSVVLAGIPDPALASAEVAQLNADSLWCRYLVVGDRIVAEAEMVDRVFVPVNLTVWLDEVVAELADVNQEFTGRLRPRLAG